ncbi:MAG TPA: phospholipase [Pirellulaceae bacterium]|nr:phospholipase [Pirellulaceae bacterium]
MSISGSALRQLHRIHRQLSDLRERLARGPKQMAFSEQNIKRAEADLATAKANHRQARVTADEKQLQLKSRDARLADLKVKLNQAQSNREFQALKEQIAADQQANSVQADEILEAMEKIDELHGMIGVAEAAVVKAKEESEKVRARVNDQQQGLENELARVLAELQAAEDLLPADFKTEYLRMTKAKGENALSQVEGGCCGQCFQMITANMENDLRLSKPLFCKSCGALLYLTEE